MLIYYYGGTRTLEELRNLYHAGCCLGIRPILLVLLRHSRLLDLEHLVLPCSYAAVDLLLAV